MKAKKIVSKQIEKALEKSRDFYEHGDFYKFNKSNVFVEFGLEELESGDISLFINDIFTEPQFQGNGYASKVLKEICNWADNNDLPISLRASAEGHYNVSGLKQNQLINWYEKYGFVLSPNGSKFYDEIFMIRDPQ